MERSWEERLNALECNQEEFGHDIRELKEQIGRLTELLKGMATKGDESQLSTSDLPEIYGGVSANQKFEEVIKKMELDSQMKELKAIWKEAMPVVSEEKLPKYSQSNESRNPMLPNLSNTCPNTSPHIRPIMMPSPSSTINFNPYMNVHQRSITAQPTFPNSSFQPGVSNPIPTQPIFQPQFPHVMSRPYRPNSLPTRSTLPYQPTNMTPRLIAPNSGYPRPIFLHPSPHETLSKNKPKLILKPSKKKEFDSIPILYSELYSLLFQEDLVVPVQIKPMNPPYPEWFDETAKCDYHVGICGHTTENCMMFKHKVQDLINTKVIEFTQGKELIFRKNLSLGLTSKLTMVDETAEEVKQNSNEKVCDIFVKTDEIDKQLLQVYIGAECFDRAEELCRDLSDRKRERKNMSG